MIVAARLVALAFLCLAPAAAEEAPVRAVEVVDGATLRLDDGQTLRLAGILPPLPPRDDAGERGPAIAARVLLARLAADRALVLRNGEATTDRHGRRLAQAFLEDGTWLQGELLRRGLARVHTAPDNRLLAAEMLALEREARAAATGIWSDRRYAIRGVDETPRLVDTFQLVEGSVVAAVKVKSQIFLNFGPDWRTDFTIRVPTPALKLFRAARVDPLKLQGSRVRVRGWLRWDNGPMIDATHPEQIELLSPATVE